MACSDAIPGMPLQKMDAHRAKGVDVASWTHFPLQQAMSSMLFRSWASMQPLVDKLRQHMTTH